MRPEESIGLVAAAQIRDLEASLKQDAGRQVAALADLAIGDERGVAGSLERRSRSSSTGMLTAPGIWPSANSRGVRTSTRNGRGVASFRIDSTSTCG